MPKKKTAQKQAGAPKEPVQFKIKTSRATVIHRRPEEIYYYWRDFHNLPQFMDHVEEVEVIDDKHSHWKAKGVAGKSFEWDAEITSERENEFISWRSTENAEIENAGSVEFEAVEGGEATKVVVTLAYNPPAGKAGHGIAEWLGATPEQEIEHDLQKLKENLENEDHEDTRGRGPQIPPLHFE